MTTKKSKSSAAQRRRAAQPARRNPAPLLIGGVALILVAAGVIAIALSSSSAEEVSQPAASPVAVTGTVLPAFTATQDDPAIGMTLPAMTSIGLDGQPMTISPDDGAQAIVILAHWCPHCQAELPRLVEWLSAHPPPAGVAVVGLTTAIDPARPNYPPTAWLAREGWTAPTLIDDAVYTAYRALGGLAFPGFVFVDADGTVHARVTGEIEPEEFGQWLEEIAP
ncbi:MAG TPA: TlpA disulfide reductase family protein [Candidatus Limnocylindria bacterium]|jgi:thiol-disulfide isomerase/thioredoxin